MIRVIVAILLSLQLMMPYIAMAQDKIRGPLDYSLKQYGIVLAFAVLGGFVQWWAKVRRGDIPAWSVSHLIGELCTSAFAGLLCFWVCEWANFPPLLTAALTGVCGHMGTRAVSMFEEFAAKKFGSIDQGSKP